MCRVCSDDFHLDKSWEDAIVWPQSTRGPQENEVDPLVEYPIGVPQIRSVAAGKSLRDSARFPPGIGQSPSVIESGGPDLPIGRCPGRIL